MVRSKRSFVVQIVVTFLILSAVWAESKVDTKVADCFKVRLHSGWHKNTGRYDFDFSVFLREGSPVPSLSLFCEIEILDPNLVLGTCYKPVIVQLTDSKGQVICTSQTEPRPTRLCYRGLSYYSYSEPLEIRPWQGWNSMGGERVRYLPLFKRGSMGGPSAAETHTMTCRAESWWINSSSGRMDGMRKVWIYKRKNTKGWWCGWYESGKRKTKALPTKALAEHYRRIFELDRAS